MLALIFRSVFLLAILGWYSTSVWKMIDNYFKQQFRVYLEEEFKKNPHMKSDLDKQSAAGKINPVIIEATVATLAKSREIEEICRADNFPGDTTDSKAGFILPTAPTIKFKETSTDHAEKHETAKGSADKNAFLEAAKSGLESGKLTDDTGGGTQSTDSRYDSIKLQGKTASKSESRRLGKAPRHDSDIKTNSQTEKNQKETSNTRSFASMQRQNTKKRKVQTITLTEKDFKSTTNLDPDFWEFEEDENVVREGILVSDLPFKPKADIGNLDRVTAEEYCPLTLDDELSCKETVKWP